MHVVVTAASKHGATREIAFWIQAAFMADGIHAVVREPDELTRLDAYDAVVLGSGVYAGKWLGEATKLVERLEPELKVRPVWLFSSGPAGDPPRPDSEPVDVAPMMAASAARTHTIFPGKIDRATMGFAERAICAALRVPDGDFRKRDEVEAWAHEIATSLSVGTSPTPAPAEPVEEPAASTV
jgi:menaquinone-dependent protoporphyrinogen oxidase